MSSRSAVPHPAALAVEQLLEHCEIRRTRRSGPGGQHRNKVETAVVITHVPTGIQGEASERRSQDMNRREALQRLRVNLALHVRGTAGASEQPSSLWLSRANGGKISVSPEHTDFPALLAEALDVLAAADGHLSLAAERLAVSASQLTKFFQQHPAAMTQINVARRARGLRALQ